MNTRSVCVVGGGTMGVDIAASFAAFGWRTVIVNPPDPRAATIADRFKAALGRLERNAEFPVVKVETLMEVSWSEIELVIEAIPEDLALKRAIFRELEGLARPDIALCSNSSAIPISEIGRGLDSIHRMVGVLLRFSRAWVRSRSV